MCAIRIHPIEFIEYNQKDVDLQSYIRKYLTQESDRLLYGVLSCEWSNSSTSKIINSLFPPIINMNFH